MKFRSLVLVAAAATACVTPPTPPAATAPPMQFVAPKPPVARRETHVETLHGQQRSDDYAWLRNKHSPDVEQYLQTENAYTDAWMQQTKGLQQELYQELVSHLKQTDISVPYSFQEYLYYRRTEEGQQYPIYCRKKSVDAPEQVLLNLNALAQHEKFVGLGAWSLSTDGNELAFALDTTGFRVFTLQVKDLRNGALGVEHIDRVDSIAWAADNRTLFYVTEKEAKRPSKLWRHTLGSTGPDALVYEETDEKFDLRTSRTRSEGLIVVLSESHTTTEVRIISATRTTEPPQLVAPRVANQEYFVEDLGKELLIRVNDTGRNFRVVRAPLASPGRDHWKEARAQSDEVMIEDVEAFATHWVMLERNGGLPQLEVIDSKSAKSQFVPFPEPSYALFPESNEEFGAREFRYQYSSLTTPRTVFSFDPVTGKSAQLKQDEVPGYDRTRYTAERVEAIVADGTHIPISVVYRTDRVPDGSAPLLLTGYGSYGLPYPVTFDSNRLALLDRGVAIAIAHIRGGGEHGKKWHDQGRMMNKRNTFTDFIAAAEYLIANRYTSPQHLAITGGSAGGLLMGAVVNLRPELFKAVVAQVPFVDVINTMLDETLPLTVGEFEAWGNPKLEAEYKYMMTYSPIDNVGRHPYPAMLVKSSYNDSQVMYFEPAKWVARLRANKVDDHLLLLSMDMEPAGHGGKSGRYERLHEVAFVDAFLIWQLGLKTEASETR